MHFRFRLAPPLLRKNQDWYTVDVRNNVHQGAFKGEDAVAWFRAILPGEEKWAAETFSLMKEAEAHKGKELCRHCRAWGARETMVLIRHRGWYHVSCEKTGRDW